MAPAATARKLSSVLPRAFSAGVLVTCLCCNQWQWRAFSNRGAGVRAPATARRATGSAVYPELARVEDLIYDSCVVMEGRQELECLRAWDKLTKFHVDAAHGCSLEEKMPCLVLNVLDRLCKGIDGTGLMLMQKVASTVLAWRSNFMDWDTAFAAADMDGSGEIDLEEFTAAMQSANAGMTRAEAKLVFDSAGANEDGLISKEEFTDFMDAHVLLEETLQDLQMDCVPRGQPDFYEYLRLSANGGDAGTSWAGLSRLMR